MKESIASLLDHYAVASDGSSALLRADLIALCQRHSVPEAEFCDAFARERASRYASGDLDADRAAFAADDLYEAADFVLPPFASRVFDLLEYREATPADAKPSLARLGQGTAA